MPVNESTNSVVAAAIGATASMIVGKIVPGRSVRTVIFAHGSPLALAEIWTPALPTRLPVLCFFQSFALFHGSSGICPEKRTPTWFVRAALHSADGSAILCGTAAAFKPEMAAVLKDEYSIENKEYRIPNSEHRTPNREPGAS